jgi:hypothetical protein
MFYYYLYLGPLQNTFMYFGTGYILVSVMGAGEALIAFIFKSYWLIGAGGHTFAIYIIRQFTATLHL